VKIPVFFKILLNLVTKQFPGPGTYDLPSVFDKTKRNKQPLN